MNKQEIDKILFGIGCDSYNRFHFFIKLIPKLKGANYWYALNSAYTSTDNLFLVSDLVKASFLKDEPEREALMTSTEREYLENLPEQITIYRGMTEKEFSQNNFGVSWSLKKEVAEFFAYRYIRNHSTAKEKKTVHKLTINKSEVIAFINGRNEFEIIYIKNTPSNGSY
jgi:hypothetical protein